MRLTALLLVFGCTVPHAGLGPGEDSGDDAGGPDAMDVGSDVRDGGFDAGDGGVTPDGGFDACVPTTESCNGLDDDCDGVIDNDADEACSGPSGGMCRPGVRTCESGTLSAACIGEVLPTAEVCDGALDENCDGNIDEGCSCVDGTTVTCRPELSVGECRPGTATCAGGTLGACEGFREPVAETCNGRDDDCDGDTDEDAGMVFYRDFDGDGFGTPSDSRTACAMPAGYVGNDDDCDDMRGSRNPSATEGCNGFDDNCDGQVDETSCEACARGTFGGHTYLFCSIDFRWGVARGPATMGGSPVGCRSFGYDLVKIDNSAENTWLFENAPGDDEWWIGLQRNGGGYTWVDGTTALYSGAPIRSGSGDGCFALDDEGSSRGDWALRDCDGSFQDTNAFICEVPR